MIVRDYQLHFIAFLNFIKPTLSDMPRMGLSSVFTKDYFPYKALSKAFYNYIGKKLDIEMYSPGAMSRIGRNNFWNSIQPF